MTGTDHENISSENMSTNEVLSTENPEIEIENVKTSLKETAKNFTNKYKKIAKNEYIDSLNESLQNVEEKFYSALRNKEMLSSKISFTDELIRQMENLKNGCKNNIEEIQPLIAQNVGKLAELKQEKQELQNKMKARHDALKQATKYYKTHLQFHLGVAREENILVVTVCFFKQKFDDTYSAILKKYDNETKWSLSSTKPKLDEDQFRALQNRFDDNNDVSLLLCTIRKIMLRYKNAKK